jgi:hypothetical protein
MIAGLAPFRPNMPNPTAMQLVVVGHEIPFKPLTALGIATLFHSKPALDETTTVSIPAAKQTAVVGQSTELSPPVPVGGASFHQLPPPLVVSMIVEPAPLFPSFPIAMQSTDWGGEPGEEHETPVKLTAFDGGDWRLQLTPLLEVPIA